MFIYGLGTEILQREMHLGRSMELLDLFADLLECWWDILPIKNKK